MKTSDSITVTQGRFKKALKNHVDPIVMPTVNNKINKAVKDSQIQTGIMTKFYPYLDKCEVQLDEGSTVICKILHRFGGELIEFFTPLSSHEEFCETLNEPCIVPRAGLNVCVLNINDNTKEQIMIGYFLSDDLIDIEPAEEGNIKISASSGTNEYWISFGQNGLDIRSPKSPVTTVGGLAEEMEEVKYSNANDTYTKEEIDKMIEDLKNELLGENNYEPEGG